MTTQDNHVAALRDAAEISGISIGKKDGGRYPTIEQLAQFAALTQPPAPEHPMLEAGGRRAWMCQIAFDHEIEGDADGAKVYPSLDALKKAHPMWEDCGVVEVVISEAASPAAPEGAKPCSYPVCGCQKVDPRTLKGCAAQPPHPQPQAQGAPTGCACRWDKDDNRVQTCERHQGWLDVVHEWAERAKSAEAELQSHREAIAKRDAALVACVEAMCDAILSGKPANTWAMQAAITHANQVLEGGGK